MDCPVCKVELKISERQGIEIDYCQKCRGIWLDRGEIDKIIERSAADISGREREQMPAPVQQKYENYEHKKYRKKSFFEELFD